MNSEEEHRSALDEIGGITRLVKRDDELGVARARLRQLLEHSPAVLYILRLEGDKIVPHLVSENITRLLGFTVPETMNYEWWFGHLHPDDRDRALQITAETIAEGVSRTEYRLRHKDGHYRWVDDAQRVIRDAAGRPFELIGVWTDITERKRTEQALRESEAKFRQVVENIREVFWMTDAATNRVLYISPSYEAIWGRTCKSLYAEPGNWIESIHSEDQERVLKELAINRTGRAHEITYRITRPDGSERWIRDRAFPVLDQAGGIDRIVGTAEDITEFRKLEDKFRHTQKMDAIGTLAGGIAHDFNNILSAIVGYTELAQMKMEADPEITEYLEAVLRAAERAADLSRQILAFSRQRSGERQPMQLRLIVSEALKQLRAAIPAAIEFDISLATDTPNVLADAAQIHQVMMNLCTNAAHAMNERAGRLTVNLENFPVDANFAALNPDLRPGGYVRLSVRDTGHGMEPATLARIFEPFFTTKVLGEGTGMGLAAVHGIMRNHQGAVLVQSQPGEGTIFRLYFPGCAGEPLVEKPLVPTAPRGQGERILFLDDEPALAHLGQKILEMLGYAVDPRTNPAEALEAVSAKPDRYDLVVTDQIMPGMTGSDLAQKIHDLRPDLPIILTTGCGVKLNAERFPEIGVRELLLKPISVESLGTVVQRVLSGAKRK